MNEIFLKGECSLTLQVGRAIRHKNDWASLILVDSRYSSEKVRGKLPGWINKDLYISQSFGQVMKSLGDFYRAKR